MRHFVQFWPFDLISAKFYYENFFAIFQNLKNTKRKKVTFKSGAYSYHIIFFSVPANPEITTIGSYDNTVKSFGSWNYDGDIVTCGGSLIFSPQATRPYCYISKAEQHFATRQPFPPLTDALKDFQTCIIGGVLWLAGGTNYVGASAQYMKLTMYFDAGDNVWKRGPNFPGHVPLLYDFAFVEISDTEALIIGGRHDHASTYTDDVYRLDTTTNSFDESYPDLPVPMSSHGGIKYKTSSGQESVLAMGGAGDDKQIYKSDLPNGAWSRASEMEVDGVHFAKPVCSPIPTGEEVWCARTWQDNVQGYMTHIHRFDPEGPPYWIKLPFDLLTYGNTHPGQYVFYNMEKRICC